VILTPLLGVFVISRTGRLDIAQVIVSAVLAAITVFAGAGAGLSLQGTFLALAVVPLQASAMGSRRAFLAACGFMVVGILVASQVQAGGGGEVPLAAILAVAATLVLAHAASRMVMEARLESLLTRTEPAEPSGDHQTLFALDDLVTWHDRNGAILRSNGASTKLFGASCAAIHGSGLFTRILVGDRPAFLKAVSDAARGATTATAQFRVKTGDGRESTGVIWVEMRVHGVRLSDDLACAAVAVTRDISAHRSYAEERDALRREAVNANDARAELLSTVSHELRTPLNAIIGYSEILMGRGNLVLLERRESYAEIIHQSGEHMLGVVNTLLDLSSIEAGQYRLDLEPVGMSDLVRECCAVLALRAEEAGVSLRADCADDLPLIVADRRACRQMLLNLLSNGVKFTPRGGEVLVEVRRDREWLALSVRDTGIGVAAEDLSRLGAPFYRGAARSRADEKGSGLGLSVVRGLVALHRGRMRITSAPGNGTIVRISLPVDGLSESDARPDTKISTVAQAPNALALPRPSDMIVLEAG
jgi:cell cycle sensor histidine kinase DivJ